MRVTARGWGMLIAGLLLGAMAAAMQSLTLARLAAVVLAIPLAALAWSFLSRAFARRRGLERKLTPTTWQVDAPGSVELVPTGAKQPPWASLRERVPASLRRRSHSRFGYGVLPEARGRHTLGPAILQRSDPLAISSWRTPIGQPTGVLVWPRTEQIDGEVLARALEASAPVAVGTPQRMIEDLTVREYRRGDDLHRVHWRSTARQGELMVRHDEPTTTRVLDMLLVLSAHEDDITEWAVSAAASMTTSLLEASYAVRVVTVVGGQLVEASARSTADALDVFALASPAGETGIDAVRSVQRSTAAGVIAVLDRPDPVVGAAVVASGGLEVSTALVIDPTGAASDLVDGLERSGWLVATSPGTGSISDAWRTREVSR
ncbi:DUF58 domain-containing protein [Pseudactinotalea terrae]|uniref:DUF58 domain-containing protein n=1 Tax=Pseudactinotalea terrae TaxID=1743262 RepID=UPI0012E0CF82|nr:DUF58 domain-containing protein [Pseudactinotalea terrae]